MAYLKLMMDDRELASLDAEKKVLRACPETEQHLLPWNLFIKNAREVPLVDVVVWAKKRVFPKERMDCAKILQAMGLPEYDAWEIVQKNKACLMEDPYWLRFSEEDLFADTVRGRARAAGCKI